jgi:hypothetical protein
LISTIVSVCPMVLELIIELTLTPKPRITGQISGQNQLAFASVIIIPNSLILIGFFTWCSDLLCIVVWARSLTVLPWTSDIIFKINSANDLKNLRMRCKGFETLEAIRIIARNILSQRGTNGAISFLLATEVIAMYYRYFEVLVTRQANPRIPSNMEFATNYSHSIYIVVDC